MDVTDEVLLSSGFTPSDLQKIKNNVESYGGTLGEAIQDLANRFRVVLWITSACLMVFIILVLFSAKETVVGGWNINSDRNSHRYIYSAASPFLQILAVLEKIQRLMVRCVSRKQVKYYFGLKSITYYFHC
ncbi:Uncharacterised protein [Enterobacter cancerogenus]|uniref:Uncharacterized protein n=1 Tax=Enterobacter cancerogenus TaxID=69218 RepID=A0A484YZJ9_9ENTR|nr:Uncharacterised protein [Enterobacter cancerogenus]